VGDVRASDLAPLKRALQCGPSFPRTNVTKQEKDLGVRLYIVAKHQPSGTHGYGASIEQQGRELVADLLPQASGASMLEETPLILEGDAIELHPIQRHAPLHHFAQLRGTAADKK